jgi:SAM-dependent methyltransferase
VDNSQELLAILQTETNGRYAGLKCLLADIMTLELEEKFDVVILGTTSICLFDVLERRLLLAKIRGWMAPGGEFLVSLRVPDLGEAGTLRHQLSEDLAIEESYDRATEKFTSTLIHHSGDGEEPTEYSVSTHHLTEDGLEDELAAAGLAVGTALEVGPQDGSGAPGTYLMFKVRVTNTSVGEEAVSE